MPVYKPRDDQTESAFVPQRLKRLPRIVARLEHGRLVVRHTRTRTSAGPASPPGPPAALRYYVDRFRGEEPDPRFLTTRTHAPMARGNGVRRILGRAAERAGIEGVHPIPVP